MSFDWSEYLNLAQELVESAEQTESPISREGKFRTAISRAYYAAFCTARNYLRDQDGDASIIERGNVHSYVRNEFRASSDRRRRTIGEGLARLLTYRQNADYEDTWTNLPIHARFSLLKAREVITQLRDLPPKRNMGQRT